MTPVLLVLALQAPLVQVVTQELSYIIQYATQIVLLPNISIQQLLLVLLVILLALLVQVLPLQIVQVVFQVL